MDSVREICYKARQASYDLAMCDAQAKNRALQAIADRIEADADEILRANALDLQQASEIGRSEEHTSELQSPS